MNQIPAIVNFLTGPDLVFQTADAETIRRLGGRDVIGKPLLEAIPEYRGQQFPQILREVLETGKPFSAIEVPARVDVDGRLEDTYWTVVYQPVRSASGVIEGVMTFDLDVTEQVLARKKLQETSAALEEALQRAADNDFRKNEFLATLAHELRNPLGPVLNSLEILKRVQTHPELLERARATIERQVIQMKRLIDDLLDVSRMTRNQIEIRKTHVDLGEVLGNAVEASRPACEAVGHTLSLRPLEEPVFLEADPDRLTQIFDNLFTNACKYTDPGGRIEVVVDRQGSDVVVRVSDNGIGIPSDLLTRVFERFVQVDRSLERGNGGLGIGLALVKQLVELHGGTVSAHSAGVGKGSEFVVRLPILTSLASTRELLPAPSTSSWTLPARILLVDDNRDTVDSLSLLLALAGYDTMTAYDGVEALEQTAAFRPDVVLLDIGLPRMSGYDVCRSIRAEPWGKDILVIALTGWGHADDRARTAEAGFNAHLVKPVDHESLMKLLDNSHALRHHPSGT